MKHSMVNPLVTALASGQPEGYAELYDRLGQSLLRVAGVMLRSQTDAEDAVQDVFMEIVRRRDRLAAVQNLDTYIFAMLRHTVGRRLTRQGVEQRHLKQWAMMTTTNQPHCCPDDLEIALRKLPLEQREVIALKTDADLTFAEVAEILNVNPNTAASRYRYAIDKLRKTLDKS